MTARSGLTVRAVSTIKTASQPWGNRPAAREGERSRTAQPARRVFDGSHDQVAQARAFTRKVLGAIPVVNEVVLLVSELCTNTLLHTASGNNGKFELTICPGPGRVRVEVRDDGSEHEPATRPPDPAVAAGRGLQLVAALAESWGYVGDRNGRVVFFQMSW